MRKFTRYAVVPMAIGSLSACADQSSGPTGPTGNLELSVAPLSLPGITNAVYTITVKSGTQTVWSESSLSADQYGNGEGSLTYIGTCDASPGNTAHVVSLTLESLSDASGVIATGEYDNPCPAGNPCTVGATCVENSDTLVVFNLAIMRDANQGFFDIAVNFSDIFCSAKVDCQDALLFNGATRKETAVVGFACTSGYTPTGSKADTWLHLSNITVSDTSGAVITIDPDLKDASSNQVSGNGGGGSYAVYRDMEDFGSVNKGFWNVAIRLDSLAAGTYTLAATGSASDTATLDGGSVGDATYNRFAVINFGASITKAAGDSIATCSEQQLNAAGSLTQAVYVSEQPQNLKTWKVAE